MHISLAMTRHLTAIAFITRLSWAICQPKGVQDPPHIAPVTLPATHGEGPHWDPVDRVLYFVDIAGETLHRYDPATKQDKSLKLDKPVALVVPVKDQKNKFVVGLGRELVLLTWDWETGAHFYTTIAEVDQNEPRNRFNDGKADASGRIWAGTMGYEPPGGQVEENKGAFYYFDTIKSGDCNVNVKLSGVTISNGLAWSHDNKVLYYIDTPTNKIVAFDFDLQKGEISNKRTVFDFKENNIKGSPDGMTIDVDGNLWIACYGGWQVIKVNPSTGTLLHSIRIPAEKVSSVSWGGDKLDTLYVTTIKLGLTSKQLDSQPDAGSVFAVTNLKTFGTLQNKAIVKCGCFQ